MNDAPGLDEAEDAAIRLRGRPRFLRIKEVAALTTLSPAMIWKLSSDGAFPRQFKLGMQTSAWDEREVLKWMENRMQQKAPRRPGKLKKKAAR